MVVVMSIYLLSFELPRVLFYVLFVLVGCMISLIQGYIRGGEGEASKMVATSEPSLIQVPSGRVRRGECLLGIE